MLDMDLINIISLALFGSVVALIGGVVFLYNRNLSQLLEKYSISFAAGVLITVSFLGLLPESEHVIGESAYLITLVSFLLILFFEHFFFGIHHHDDGQGHKVKESSTFLVIIGDTIHNFIDGVTIAASYLVSPGLGLITALSTFLHEIPHEIGDFGILLKAEWKKLKILSINFLSALSTVVGALFVYIYNENEILHGTLMAISAGIFLYLGTVDFLPRIEADSKNKLKSILPLLFGAVVIATIMFLVPHDH